MTNSPHGVDALNRWTTIVDTLGEVTPRWVTDALRYAGVLRRGEVIALTSDLMNVGQLGLVVRLSLTYDGAEPGPLATVMLKLPSNDARSRKVGTTLGIYEGEVRFYQQIAPAVAIRVPRLYHAGIEPATGRFTLLREDLSTTGTPGDMIAGGTPQQAAQALDALTALHAPTWSDPALSELKWLADPGRNQVFLAGVQPMLPLFLERFGDRLDRRDVALVEQVTPHANGWAARMTQGHRVVLHGDYRMDNVFFPHDAAAPVAVFDWQATRLGPPLVDASVYLVAVFRWRIDAVTSANSCRGITKAWCLEESPISPSTTHGRATAGVLSTG